MKTKHFFVIQNPSPEMVEYRLSDGVCPKCGMETPAYYYDLFTVVIYCPGKCGNLRYHSKTFRPIPRWDNPFMVEYSI